MGDDLTTMAAASSHHMRLTTLIKVRWLAVIGQSTAVLVVAYGLQFPFPVMACFTLIAVSVWLNLFLMLRYPTAHRVPPQAALGVLVFDTLQLSGLLYLTGGLTNPFALLMIVPAVISATSLPLRWTVLLCSIAVALSSLLAFFHLPLPWFGGAGFSMPFIYIVGIWIAVVLSIIFAAVYAYRVAEEARLLANALAATELVLQREQHLSAIDGLAAAAAHELGTPLSTIALVAKEMERALGEDPRFSDDVTLLRSQSERCRAILKRLTSLSAEGDAHLARLPLTSMIEEVIAPHRDFGIQIDVERGDSAGPEPVGRRNPGVIYGLGNLLENAVDFAREKVAIRYGWDEAVYIEIEDDGPGFPPDIIVRIGEPYISRRTQPGGGGGLGLGLFIAKTLLERSGAGVDFRNAASGGGALIRIVWPKSAFRLSASSPSGTEAR